MTQDDKDPQDSTEIDIPEKALKAGSGDLGDSVFDMQVKKCLVWITIAASFIMLAALLVFVFCVRFCSGEHTLYDIPVILALSAVPTTLLIILIRYYHRRPNDQKEDIAQEHDTIALTPQLNIAADALKLISDTAKSVSGMLKKN